MFLICSSLFLIILFVISRKRTYLKSSLIYTLTSLSPLLLFCFWSLKTVFYNLVRYPMTGYINANKISYNLLIVFLVIWFFLLAYLFLKKEKSLKTWFLMIIQLGFLVTTYPLPDFFHISLVIFPLFFIILSFVDERFNGTTKILSYIFPVFLLVALLPLVIFNLVTNKFNLVTWSDRNYKITEYIKNNCPGKYLYAGPFVPNFYFETRKMNATPYSFLITSQQSLGQFSDAFSYLRKNKPSCAILVYHDYLIRFKHNPNNQIEEYIKDKYKLIYQPTEGIFIYKNLENNW
jgi:hypothetical protein